jgi:hypothetical protein
MTRLFLDANVLFTAAHNPKGKAALKISLGQHRLVELATSAYAGLLPGWPVSNIHLLRQGNTFSFRIWAA